MVVALRRLLAGVLPPEAATLVDLARFAELGVRWEGVLGSPELEPLPSVAAKAATGSLPLSTASFSTLAPCLMARNWKAMPSGVLAPK